MSKLENLLLREYEFTNSEDEKAILLMRLSRTPQGFVIYCKSPLFNTFFKELSNGQLVDYAWGDDSSNQQYNLNTLWSSPTFDAQGAVQDYNDPDEFVPKTLPQALKGYGQATVNYNPASISSNTVWKGTPNLSFITSCKLGEGCNFLIRTPISDAMFDAFYESSKHYLTWIHDNFLTPKYATYKMFAKKKEI